VAPIQLMSRGPVLDLLTEAARGNPTAPQGPESFGNYGQGQDGTENYWGH